MLEKLGCRVDVVANGLEAVEAVSRIAYDCVFMDCQMPEMDGYEATVALRQHEKQTRRSIPIIAMTANAMQGDREQCLAVGMNDYVSKPVNTDDLSTVLRKWVWSSAPAAAELPPVETAPIHGPAAAVQADSPALDAEAFATFRELCGDDAPEVLIDIITQFIQDTPGYVEALRNSVNTHDASAVQRVAHTLKSSSANVGAYGMVTLCQTLEQQGKEQTLSDAATMVEQLAQEFCRVQLALEHKCGKARGAAKMLPHTETF
jgi:CheY-like chemotaxis protein